MSKVVGFIDAKLNAAAAVMIVLFAVVANGSLLFAQYAPPSGFDTPMPAFGGVSGGSGVQVSNVDTVVGDGSPSASLPSPSGAETPSTDEGASSVTLTADVSGGGRDGNPETTGSDPRPGSASTLASNTVSNAPAPTGSGATLRNTDLPGSIPRTAIATLQDSSGSPGVPQRFVPVELPAALREESVSPVALPNTPLEEPFPYVPPAVPAPLPGALQEQPTPPAVPEVPAALPDSPLTDPLQDTLPTTLPDSPVTGPLQDTLPTTLPDSPLTDSLQDTLPSVQPGVVEDSIPINDPGGLLGDGDPTKVLDDGNEKPGLPGVDLPVDGIPGLGGGNGGGGGKGGGGGGNGGGGNGGGGKGGGGNGGGGGPDIPPLPPTP